MHNTYTVEQNDIIKLNLIYTANNKIFVLQ